MDYGGGGICSLAEGALGKREFFLLCEEMGTANFVLAHFYFVAGTLPVFTTIANSLMSFGVNNEQGTQVVTGYTGDGTAGTLRWTAW